MTTKSPIHRTMKLCAHTRLALVLFLCASIGDATAGSCLISSSGLAFGAYQPLTFAGKRNSSDLTGTATVSISCTGITLGGGYTVSLGPGTFGSGNRISNRFMSNAAKGGPEMAYNVYIDATHDTIWGNGSIGSNLIGTLATGISYTSHTVYGKVPSGQNTLKAGSYVDSLTMTITYSP